MTLRFVLVTANGSAAVERVAETLEHALEAAPGSAKRLRPDEWSDETHKIIDPISLAALILSVPSAALAVVDLADRIKKRRRAARLLEVARDTQNENGVVVHILTVGGSVRLDSVGPDQILDLASTEDSADSQ